MVQGACKRFQKGRQNTCILRELSWCGHFELSVTNDLYVINSRRVYRWTCGCELRATLTWCRAVRPSTFAVSMSAPFCSSRSTSSLSPAAHAAKNTQPDENFILRVLDFGDTGSRFVSDWAHRFSCSALLNRAELERVSIDMLFNQRPDTALPIRLSARQKTTVRWLDQSKINQAGIIKSRCINNIRKATQIIRYTFYLRTVISSPYYSRQYCYNARTIVT